MKFIIIIIIIVSPLFGVAHALSCQDLSGVWHGKWNDSTTSLEIRVKGDIFSGNFKMHDNMYGSFSGKCSALMDKSYYLYLKPDPPLYNPCRGLLIYYKKTNMLHIFCYSPNQDGYFLHA